MFKEKMKKDLKSKIIEELKKASDYLDISIKYEENDIIVYGSIFDKENPNDIDVYVQVDIDLDNSNPIYQVYDFEEYETIYYDGEINAKNAIKDYLHGYILGKDQPSYEGKKLDINVELFDFEEGQYNSYKEGNYQKVFTTEFIEFIYATLASWGMHRMGPDNKGAKMNDFTIFKECILKNKENFRVKINKSLRELFLSKLDFNELNTISMKLGVHSKTLERKMINHYLKELL